MEPKDILSINPLLMDRTRLAILATLVPEDTPMDFVTLLDRLELTRGNLSVHTRKLEDAGFVTIDKKFLDRNPVTTYVCTVAGRRAMEDYLSQMEGLLGGALKVSQ